MNNEKQHEKMAESQPANLTREQVRAKLLAAGLSSTSVRVPKGAVPLTPLERERIGRIAPGSPTTTDIVDQDRGTS